MQIVIYGLAGIGAFMIFIILIFAPFILVDLLRSRKEERVDQKAQVKSVKSEETTEE